MTLLSTKTIVDSLHFGDEMFRSLKGVVPVCTPQGVFNFTSGRHSVLLEVVLHHQRYGLKCYTKPQPHLEELCATLSHTPSDLIIHPTALPEELWVGDRYVDIALYPRVEGHTLDREVRRAAYNHNSELLAKLLNGVCQLALRLLRSEWRHGDLKCENIIVKPDGKMILVDCDALYSPELPFRGEVGTPPFIHPERGEAYDIHIDDYAIALIITSIGALIQDPALADKEPMVAAPSEGHKEAIQRLFANNPPLLELHEALYQQDYAINNLNHIIECISHR